MSDPQAGEGTNIGDIYLTTRAILEGNPISHCRTDAIAPNWNSSVSPFRLIGAFLRAFVRKLNLPWQRRGPFVPYPDRGLLHGSAYVTPVQ